MPFTQITGGTGLVSLDSAAQLVGARNSVSELEFLSRHAQCAFRRQMAYHAAWRKVAANANWDAVRVPTPDELNAWETAFYNQPWLTGGAGKPARVSLTDSDANAVWGAYSMMAVIQASRFMAHDPLMFFDRTDYNLFAATSLGIPAPIGAGAPLQSNSEWRRARGEDYARGPIRARWIPGNTGNLWVCVIRGDSFGLKDSVVIDWSAIRLAGIDPQGGYGPNAIKGLENNPTGAVS